MRAPEELFTMHRQVHFEDRPVLLHAFSGFVDAGSGVRLAAEHLLEAFSHQLIATFDIDELLDYRARRPRMSFVVDHFAAVETQLIELHEVTDDKGRRFLLLAGPEPDYQWMRFIAAVEAIVERFDVRLAVALSAIPWPAPHTRPLGVTIHGNDPALLAGHVPVVGEIEVPGHVGAMLELRLGERGITSIGVTAQVPHYLVQFEYPRAAISLLNGVSGISGLALGTAGLEEAARTAEGEVAAQTEGNDEFTSVVAALEAQYDHASMVEFDASSGGIAGQAMPTGDEIAAQVEQFLSGLSSPDEPEK